LISGIIGVGADVFLFQALPRIGSRLSLLIIQCFSAISAATIEWLWLGAKLTAAQAAACATILVGVAVALAPGKHLNVTRGKLAAGIVFGLLAAFGNGFGAVLSRKGYAVAALAKQNIDGATAAYQRLIGGLLVGAICLLVVKRREVISRLKGTKSDGPSTAEKWRRAWPWVLSNGFAGQTLGVTCYQWALKTTKTGLVLAIISTTPLVVMPFARIFEGEPIAPRAVIGGMIAVAGAILLILAA
jgi:drug/metabolite transporter (DMT)-like permease